MTNFLTIPQEMFIVTLCFLFFAALVGDLGHSKFFRDYKHTPSPWNNLSKDLKALMLALIGFMTWAQNKDSLQIIDDNGLTDAMEEVISDRDPFGLQVEGLILELYGDELMQGGYVLPRDTGITWAVQTGNPPFTSNAVLLVSQFQAGFACVAVTNIQPSALAMPPDAIIFTNWPYAVARQSVLLPQYCLPEGFTFGGYPVTNLYMAASGVLSFDAPKSSPLPATNGIPDSTTLNYIAVFQTPSDIVPTNGLFWYAPGTNSSLFTWKDVYLGQDTNCLATVQAELYRDGDFTCRYYLPSLTNSYAQLTNAFLIGAQNLSGGETVLHTNAVQAIHSSYLPAFELRWKSLAGLSPDVPDFDNDWLPDADELFIYRTDPRLWDTDGDGLTDGEEVRRYGTDPLKPDSFGDGTNDFWRVVDPASLTNTPWMEGGDGLALLTLETRFDGVESGFAALRAGDVIVPVLPGTARVCRVAVPCDVHVPFALIPAPNCPVNASASVTIVASDAPGVLRDPDGIFTLPQSVQQCVYSSSALLSSGPVAFPVKTATGVLIRCRLAPDPLCPHTGNGTLSNIVVRALLPSDGATAVGLVEDASDTTPEPTLDVTEERLLEMYPSLSAAPPGVYQVAFTALVYVAAAPGFTPLPPVRRAVTAHYCVFGSGSGEDYPLEGICPCCTNQVCPCRCLSEEVCTCAVCRDPYTVNAPTNSTGQLIGTTDRAHTLLLAGGAPDRVFAGPQSSDGSSSTGQCAYCQCRQRSSPSCDRQAWTWRLTSGLNVSPSSLATNGVFTVTGVSPSEAIGGDVFTWKAGPAYSRGRYTVAGLAAAFPYAVTNTAPRLQIGHTNDLLVTTHLPTNNVGTVKFSGYTPAQATVWVKNRQTGQYVALQPSYAAATWRATYLSASQTAELRYVATEMGQYGFKVAYELTSATPSSVTNTLTFSAIQIQSEPITSETVSSTGFVYNPSGMPIGGEDRFKISTAGAVGPVPAADIIWSIYGSGFVSFVNGNNTGADIAVRANAVGDFALEVDVKGLVLTPPNVRPFFMGKVRPITNIPVSMFIVRQSDSNNPARASSDIPGLLIGANKILRQRGITLEQSGQIRYLNNDSWLNFTNVLNANTNLTAMLNTTNSLRNALEFYFVDTIEEGDFLGLRCDGGIVVARDGDALTIAHEVIHDCGTVDIYTVDNQSASSPNAIPGMVSLNYLPEDWGGGYYPPDLTQREVVGRLVMRSGGMAIDTATRWDLPSGTVYGWKRIGDAKSPKELGPAGVGHSAIYRNPGSN